MYPPSRTQALRVVPQDLVTLDCNATGTPPPTVVWFRNGEEIDPTSRRFNALPDGRLQINDVSLDDSANYTCRATNRLGEDVTTLTLTVERKECARMQLVWLFESSFFFRTSGSLGRRSRAVLGDVRIGHETCRVRMPK